MKPSIREVPSPADAPLVDREHVLLIQKRSMADQVDYWQDQWIKLMAKSQPLRWTSEVPVEAGWYWWRCEAGLAQIVLLSGGKWNSLFPGLTGVLDSLEGGEWAGPIPQPLERE